MTKCGYVQIMRMILKINCANGKKQIHGKKNNYRKLFKSLQKVVSQNYTSILISVEK